MASHFVDGNSQEILHWQCRPDFEPLSLFLPIALSMKWINCLTLSISNARDIDRMDVCNILCGGHHCQNNLCEGLAVNLSDITRVSRLSTELIVDRANDAVHLALFDFGICEYVSKT